MARVTRNNPQTDAPDDETGMASGSGAGTGEGDGTSTPNRATALSSTGRTGPGLPPPPTTETIRQIKSIPSHLTDGLENLDKTKANWATWRRKIGLILESCGLHEYAYGELEDPVNEPSNHRVWSLNDRLARSFLILHCSDADQELVNHISTSAGVLQFLRKRHEQEGAYQQLLLIQELLLEKRFSRDTPLSVSYREALSLIDRIFAIGLPTKDAFACVALLKMLDTLDFATIRSQVTASLANASPDRPYTKDDIVKLLDQEQLVINRSKGDEVVLMACDRGSQRGRGDREGCTNCGMKGHNKATCWKTGGGMEGKREEVLAEKAKKRAASGPKNAKKGGVHYATDGAAYILDSEGHAILLATSQSSSSIKPAVRPDEDFAGLTCLASPLSDSDAEALMMAMPDSHLVEHEAYTFDVSDLSATVDWAASTFHGNLKEGSTSDSGGNLLPFILDTGATTHISSCADDFSSLNPIPHHTIRGVGGSSVTATGIGTVSVQINSSTALVLRRVLYVPSAKLRLISIGVLCADDDCTATFDSQTCRISSTDGSHIATGVRTSTRGLYSLRCEPTVIHRAHIAQSIPNLESWHKRLGHTNYASIISLARKQMASGMHIDLSTLPPRCTHCILAKQVRSPVPSEREGIRAVRRLEKVFVDLSGPFCQSASGFRYVMHIVDDFSSYIWSIFLKDKASAFSSLCAWQRKRENETGLHVGFYRTDRGELCSNDMKQWLDECGSSQETTAPYTSAQNGRSERAHLTIMNKARAMRLACDLPPNRWDEFAKTAAHLTVRCPTSTLDDMTPYEAYHGVKPDFSRLREIGSRAFVLIQNKHVPKTNARSIECILIGYAQDSKAYRCYHRATHKVIESYHVTFIESRDAVPKPLYNGETINIPPANDTPNPPAQSSPSNDSPPPDPCSDDNGTTEHESGVDAAYIHVPDPSEADPSSLAEARRSANWSCWSTALEEEFRSIRDLGVYKLVPRSSVPAGRKLLQGKPVFKLKRDEHNAPTRFKARWVVKGYEQIPGLDFTTTTSPTARLESFRVIFHIAACLAWDLQQFDVKTAFLHGELDGNEYCWMEQPRGFEEDGKEDWVWELRRGLYGMKQAGRVWNKTLNEAMIAWGFTRVPCEYCIYYRARGANVIIVAIHVDDCLSAASSKEENEVFKTQLREKWEISEGDASFIVGIHVERDLKNKTISLSQTALIDSILEEFRLTEAHPVKLPMDPGLRLKRPAESSADTKSNMPYNSIIGKMMYVACATRPDLAGPLRDLSQYLANYDASHWEAAKRAVRYLKGTRDWKLVLGGTNPIKLSGYTDASYGSCPGAHSVSGYAFSLGSGAISWAARTQKSVAMSTCEAEYVAASEASKEIMWLRQLLEAIGFPQNEPTTLFADNNGAICLSEDPYFHARVKHIHVRHHYIREKVSEKHVKLQYVHTSNNVADIFTKALTLQPFAKHRSLLGVLPPSIQEEQCSSR
jgi:transposase InsO family protein